MLKDYVVRFKATMLLLSDLDHHITLAAFLTGLPPNHEL